MNWEYLGRLLRRTYQLFLGYNSPQIFMTSATVDYTCDSSTVIYAFVSVTAANEIATAKSIDDVDVLIGDIPAQGQTVICRLKSIQFTAISGTVILYTKPIKDEL
jgi:hypothetical protein